MLPRDNIHMHAVIDDELKTSHKTACQQSVQCEESDIPAPALIYSLTQGQFTQCEHHTIIYG